MLYFSLEEQVVTEQQRNYFNVEERNNELGVDLLYGYASNSEDEQEIFTDPIFIFSLHYWSPTKEKHRQLLSLKYHMQHESYLEGGTVIVVK